MTISQTTGKNIRKIRMASGMTMENLARLIHKSKSTLSKYEQGTVNMDLETLGEIAGALGVTIHHLLPPAVSESSQAGGGIPSFQHLEDSPSQIRLYLYFMGGAKNSVRKALAEINRENGDTLLYIDPYEKKDSIGCTFFYQGRMTYADSKYRMVVYNHYYKQDLFAMQWDDAMSGSHTLMGILIHFSGGAFPSFSTNCLLSDVELKLDDTMLSAMRFTKQELGDIRKRNALYSSARPQAYDEFWNL